MEIRDHKGTRAKYAFTDHLQLQLGYSGTREVTGFRHPLATLRSQAPRSPGSPEKVFRNEGGGVGHLFQLATPASVT